MEKKILVVDDEKPIVDILKINLKRDGYTVYEAYNGEDGLNKAKTMSPDLVLLDVYLPIMDGREVLTEIRNSKIDTEVIMVTAANDTSTLEETVHLGVVDYLIKPFSFVRFQNALEKFTAQHQAFKEKTIMDQNFVDNFIKD